MPNKQENVLTSYRPISLLSIFSKIFERILLERLLPVLDAQNIIPEHQFGFRNKHGTPEQCHRVGEVISNTLERKYYCSAVFLDIQQAFDRVWHSGILYKLKKLLPAPFYLLLKSYLHQRRFYVSINNECSEFGSIHSGVPQGSVLGPVLYTVFTSDMPTINGLTIATYADDTAIMASEESHIKASDLLQNGPNHIQEWLNKWNIKVNTEKSVHITFTLRKNDCPSVSLNGSSLPQSKHVKYLGLYIDRRLTWGEHIKIKRKQLNTKTKKIYWLLGPNSTLTLENKVILYKTILKPVSTYGVQLWGTASNSNI